MTTLKNPQCIHVSAVFKYPHASLQSQRFIPVPLSFYAYCHSLPDQGKTMITLNLMLSEFILLSAAWVSAPLVHFDIGNISSVKMVGRTLESQDLISLKKCTCNLHRQCQCTHRAHQQVTFPPHNAHWEGSDCWHSLFIFLTTSIQHTAMCTCIRSWAWGSRHCNDLMFIAFLIARMWPSYTL